MNRISINGQSFNFNDNDFRNGGGNVNVNISGDGVYVNGKLVKGGLSGIVEIRWQGDLASVKADGSVTCGNVQGSVEAGGSVHCQAVGGDVDAGGSVRMMR